MSSSTPTHPAEEQQQPLRSAMKNDDDSDRPSLSTRTSSKAVQIAEPEPSSQEDVLPRRRFSAGIAKRLSGRPSIQPSNSSMASLISQTGLEALNSYTGSQSTDQVSPDGGQSSSQHHHRLDRIGEKLITQISDWLDHERSKKENRRSRRTHHSRRRHHKDDTEEGEAQSGRQRTYSLDSQGSDVSLDRLQKIIDDSMSSLGLTGVPHYSSKHGRRPHRKRSVHLHRTASSDTDYVDGDALVPSCDAVLDNSKTLSYSGGTANDGDDSISVSSRKAEKERKAWTTFKLEVIRLSHTLRLKGWRRVPLDAGDSINIERLSGALTNAVYVVSPPDNLKEQTEKGKKTPAKLLLRVYGPNVEHIIDRENELNVLRRLARKRIGPRLLGTFENGRFEQYLNATALTAEELREAGTSKRIAKRMRELHDGIQVLEHEKDEGPAVWKNWDSWLNRVSQVLTYLDRKISAGNLGPVRNAADAWKERGLICGVEWSAFKSTVDKYRQFLYDRYGGSGVVREQLVFAHNDTQYGNILRVLPDDKKSPMLQPNYEHKQLVVIDFEYAAANTRGLEFANHFTEWCYNYHDEKAPFACQTSMYPKPDEQRRFLESYVNHRPDFPHPDATPIIAPLTATPTLAPSTPRLNPIVSAGSTSSIADFMLDARVPQGGWKEEEKRQEGHLEEQVVALMEETRLWRVANTAQWVAWGIMQAKIPGFDENNQNEVAEGNVEGAQPTALAAPEDEEGDPSEFDYLGYAQERAMFFWGDCVLLGLVKLEDLPEQMRSKVKFVDY